MGKTSIWLICTGVACAAIACLYVGRTFDVDPLSFIVYPVFKQATSRQKDSRFRSIESTQIDRQAAIQSIEKLELADDAHDESAAIGLWDTETLTLSRVLSDPTLALDWGSLAIDSEANTLAAVGMAEIIQVLDAKTGEPRPILLSPENVVNNVVVTNDGSQVIVAQWKKPKDVREDTRGTEQAQRWQVDFLNARTGEVERSIVPTFEHPLDEVRQLALNSEETMLAIASSRYVQFWNLEGNTLLRTTAIDAASHSSRSAIKTLSFSRDGTRLTLERDRRIQQIEVSTGETLHRIDRSNCLEPIVISPSGAIAACSQLVGHGLDSQILVIDIKTDEVITTLEDRILRYGNAFSNSGTELLVGNSTLGKYFLHNIETGKSVELLGRPSDERIAIASFSTDRKHILTQHFSQPNNFVTVISADNLQPVAAFNLPDSVAIGRGSSQLHLSQETLVVQTHQPVANIWDIDANRLSKKHSLALKETVGPHQILLSPDGQLFAVEGHRRDASSGSSALIYVGEVASGRILHTLKPSRRYLNHLEFSADSTKMLAVYGVIDSELDDDKGTLTVELLEAKTGETIQQFEPSLPSAAVGVDNPLSMESSVALSKDGTQLITGSRYSVQLWNAKTGEQLRTFSQNEDWDYRASPKASHRPRIAISKDQQWTAFVDYDGKLSIWSLETGKRLRSLPSSRKEHLQELSFSSDKKTLIGISEDRIIRWRLPSRLSLQD